MPCGSSFAYIRVQAPVHLSNNSEAEPDIAVVQIDERNCIDHYPAQDEIFLLIEVADATLKTDIGKKARLYAKAGIPDYWVIDGEPTKIALKCEKRILNYKLSIEPFRNVEFSFA